LDQLKHKRQIDSRRVELVFALPLNGRCLAVLRRTFFLFAPQRQRKYRPPRHDRQRTERNCAEFQTQSLQRVKDPA